MKELLSVSSDYHILKKLGYPQLDIVRYNDGSWSIIEYMKTPLFSSTPYRVILADIRHQEINETFLKKMIERRDPTKQILWDIEAKKSAEVEMDAIRREAHKERSVDTAMKVLSKNEDLKERVAKNGLKEMNLENIYQHIPAQQKIGLK